MEPERAFAQDLFRRKLGGRSEQAPLPPRHFAEKVLDLLFPERRSAHWPRTLDELVAQVQALSAQLGTQGGEFFRLLPEVEARLTRDAAFIHAEDPASLSVDEVILCYPGFYAIATHRIAHLIAQLGIPLVPRLLAEYAHEKTGIDIHPSATIGCPFSIDHGTGIVIGETTIIGDRVKLFQGVTLGALSVDRSQRATKRHPTLEDQVLVYSGTTILGGNTVVGKNSVIGGNVWLTRSVPANSRILYTPEGPPI